LTISAGSLVILPGLVQSDVASFWASGGGLGALAERRLLFSLQGVEGRFDPSPLHWGSGHLAWLIVDSAGS